MVIDEAAFAKNLDYLFRAVLRPMLIDRGGGLMALSSPNRKNTFYRWYLRGKSEEYPSWHSWNFSTYDNPYLHKLAGELDTLLEEYPEGSDLYKQEILGEFLDSEGRVFRGIDAVATAQKLAAPIPGREYVGGLDWGRTNDYTVLTLLDRASGEMVYTYRATGMGFTAQRKMITQVLRKWRAATLVEINSFGWPNFELLKEDGLEVTPWTMGAANKPLLIDDLATAIATKAIRIIPDPELISELESYELTINKLTQRPTYGAPDGMFDDYVVSTALAWQARKGAGLSFGIMEA